MTRTKIMSARSPSASDSQECIKAGVISSPFASKCVDVFAKSMLQPEISF